MSSDPSLTARLGAELDDVREARRLESMLMDLFEEVPKELKVGGIANLIACNPETNLDAAVDRMPSLVEEIRRNYEGVIQPIRGDRPTLHGPLSAITSPTLCLHVLVYRVPDKAFELLKPAVNTFHSYLNREDLDKYDPYAKYEPLEYPHVPPVLHTAAWKGKVKMVREVLLPKDEVKKNLRYSLDPRLYGCGLGRSHDDKKCNQKPFYNGENESRSTRHRKHRWYPERICDSALDVAVRYDQVEVALALIKEDPDLLLWHAPDYDERQKPCPVSLWKASMLEHNKSFELVFEETCKTKAFTQEHKNKTLEWASRSDDPRIMEYLKANGAEIDFTDEKFDALIEEAVDFGRPRNAKFLVDHIPKTGEWWSVEKCIKLIKRGRLEDDAEGFVMDTMLPYIHENYKKQEEVDKARDALLWSASFANESEGELVARLIQNKPWPSPEAWTLQHLQKAIMDDSVHAVRYLYESLQKENMILPDTKVVDDQDNSHENILTFAYDKLKYRAAAGLLMGCTTKELKLVPDRDKHAMSWVKNHFEGGKKEMRKKFKQLLKEESEIPSSLWYHPPKTSEEIKQALRGDRDAWFKMWWDDNKERQNELGKSACRKDGIDQACHLLLLASHQLDRAYADNPEELKKLGLRE
ncbi:hypothetical protein F4780DRAFT_507973 [Xylariomycetidae sp. FL0641]|nr:hypothetical protein F4780DRAFT_507973 [Xylariomycetidae sp. FL0641]